MSGLSPDALNSTSTTTTTNTPTQTMASVTTELSHTAALAISDPLSHVGDGIFLQTKTAQGLAGICVWVALFLTCQQVNQTFLIQTLQTNRNYNMNTNNYIESNEIF